jgi:hypothetical protein
VASTQINLKIQPALAAEWRRRAAADGLGLTAWVVARVSEALAGAGSPVGPPAADDLARRIERLESLMAVMMDRQRRGPAPAAPVASRPPATTPAPAEAITTGELADRLGIRRASFNARVSRAGGLRVGVEVSGWRCVGLQPSDRGGPPRGLWVPAGTEAVPDAG